MFKFSEVEVSKAIANGTNISCIEDRFVVCRLKKDFIVNTADNKAMFEKGDIVICTGDYDNKEWWLRLLDEQQLKSMSSEDFIKSPTSWLTYNGYRTRCSLDEFKKAFEVHNDETALVEGHINAAKEKLKGLKAIGDKIRYAKHDSLTKATTKGIAVGLTAAAFGIAGTGIVISEFISMSKVINAIVTVISISLLIFGIMLALILATEYDDDFSSLFVSRKSKRKIEKLKKEYDEQLNADIAILNKLRVSDGWYYERK